MVSLLTARGFGRAMHPWIHLATLKERALIGLTLSLAAAFSPLGTLGFTFVHAKRECAFIAKLAATTFAIFLACILVVAFTPVASV